MCFVGIGVIPIHSIKVQIGPTCQNDIFGLHVPVLDVQTFPEAQTAVEF